jgi:hypothetical protein
VFLLPRDLQESLSRPDHVQQEPHLNSVQLSSMFSSVFTASSACGPRAHTGNAVYILDCTQPSHECFRKILVGGSQCGVVGCVAATVAHC